MTTILIVYGSKLGGTAGLADMLADALREEGFEADIRPADAVGDLEEPDAVIIGGALYMGRWHRDARRFVRRHRAALTERPVWLFSSGPLDASAEEGEIPPVKQVKSLMSRIGARKHETFGGALPTDAKGFPASAMAKEQAGDWRDPEHVARFAREIADVLRTEPAAPA